MADLTVKQAQPGNLTIGTNTGAQGGNPRQTLDTYGAPGVLGQAITTLNPDLTSLLPTSPYGASAGPTSAQVNPLTSALSSTDTVRDNAKTTATSLYNKNVLAYDAEDANDLANYQKQVGQNEGNLAANRWAALLQAAQGGRGLRAVLGSLGALAGTGSTLADRAVTGAANKDIGEAGDTFETNADQLNTAWQETERQQRQRREDAVAARDNELKAADRDWASSKQGILTQLANLFGVGTSRGNTYASEAASLYPTIASNTQQSVAGYQAASPLYSQQALDTYKGGVSDLTVGARTGGVAGGTPGPLVAAPTRRRDEEVI
ncbi:MAG: hypothetical protein E6R03_13095 [Hyphomicrobiaceae bacterium]|nr:MAG: hypothetical protein E6R03_13095 [Hyphomicrobiaceae bacterium]